MNKLRGETFRGWLSNHEIREGFLHRKFPAMVLLMNLEFNCTCTSTCTELHTYYLILKVCMQEYANLVDEGGTFVHSYECMRIWKLHCIVYLQY
jgi:hypothetical protein